MYFSKEYKENYERKFNSYIIKCINGVYKNYLRDNTKSREECILNELIDEEIELLDLISSNDENEFEEVIAPKNLENYMSDYKLYKAVKPLTLNEKLVVFLCVILDKKTIDVAKIMGYSSTTSVTRLLKKAMKKIRNNLNKMGGKNNG